MPNTLYVRVQPGGGRHYHIPACRNICKGGSKKQYDKPITHQQAAKINLYEWDLPYL